MERWEPERAAGLKPCGYYLKPYGYGNRAAVAALLLAAVTWVAPGHAQEPGPVRIVDAVDLDRYVGDWFEVARLPNRFQRDCAGDVRARYTRRADGRLDVLNRCRTADGSLTEAHGVARVVDPRTSARLKVRFAPAVLSFLPMVWGDYWVLGLAGDYSWAVVGSPDRKYLWILSRTPAMEVERYEAAVAVARANGFATGEMMKTRQSGGTSGRSRGPRGRSPAAEEPPAIPVRLTGWVIWSDDR